jgi:hypothetical protein
MDQGPDAAGGVVGVDVGAEQRGQVVSAIDVASDDGEARRMVIGVDRRGEVGRGQVARIDVGTGAFVDSPAVVGSLDDDIDLLDRVLADVARPERATKGLSGGIDPEESIRRILPSRFPRFCALSSGSLLLPPSPVAM